MILNEKHGVTNDTDYERLNRLIQLIADFIYDARNGLENSNDCYNEDGSRSFSMSDIQPYYEFKHRTSKDFDMPSWLADFTITIDEDDEDTYYSKAKTEIKDGLLTISIHIHDYLLQTRKTVVSKLSHEFNHAYDDHMVDIGQNRKFTKNNYATAVDAAKKMKIGRRSYGYINMSQDCYTDAENCANIILCCNYYSSPTEKRSYIYQFCSDIIEELKEMQDQVEDYIEHRTQIAGKRNISKLEQIQASANDYGISCNLSYAYTTYKMLYTFWKNIKQIDYDILEDVYSIVIRKNKALKNDGIALGKPDTARKIQEWMNKLSKGYIKEYKKVLDTMQKQFCDILEMIEYEYKTNVKEIIDFDDDDIAELMKKFEEGNF